MNVFGMPFSAGRDQPAKRPDRVPVTAEKAGN